MNGAIETAQGRSYPRQAYHDGGADRAPTTGISELGKDDVGICVRRQDPQRDDYGEEADDIDNQDYSLD